MAISHKPGVSNWNNGRHKNTYVVTRDIKQTQPVFPQPKVEELPTTNPTEETSENIVEKQLNIEEPKQIKPKKSWDTKNQNSTPPSGSETNI